MGNRARFWFPPTAARAQCPAEPPPPDVVRLIRNMTDPELILWVCGHHGYVPIGMGQRVAAVVADHQRREVQRRRVVVCRVIPELPKLPKLIERRTA